MKRVTQGRGNPFLHLDASTPVEPDTHSIIDLISAIEIAAYELVRSGNGAAANALFYAVTELEKIKSNGPFDMLQAPIRRQAC